MVMRVDCVEVFAYDRSGVLVHEQIFSTYEWHEKAKPIVDFYSPRRRLHVDRMEFRMYDGAGELTEHSVITYRKDGALQEEWRISDLARIGHEVLYPI